MSVRHWKDDTGELEKEAKPIIEESFPELAAVNILFTFRDPPAKAGAGKVVAGTCRAISARDRDLFGYDFEICMAEAVWGQLLRRQKKRLTWHELRHARVDLDEDGNPVLDKEERVKIWVEDHDIDVRTFHEEIEEFGMDRELNQLTTFFVKTRRKAKEDVNLRKRLRRPVLGTIVLDGEEGDIELDF
jgi:hypothetical protein